MEGLISFRPQNILTVWVMVLALFLVIGGIGFLWPKSDA